MPGGYVVNNTPGQNLTPDRLNAVAVQISGALSYTYKEANKVNDAWFAGMILDESTPDDTITMQMLEDEVGFTLGTKHKRPGHRRLSGEQQVIKVEKWEDGVAISHHDIAGDRIGQYMDRARKIGEGYALLAGDRIVSALALGETSAYPMADGLPYFDNAHTKGGTTFDNLLAGVLSSTTFQAARTAMLRFPSDKGATRPLGILPSDLVVAPDLEYTARELMNNSWTPRADVTSTGAAAIENVIRGMCQVRSDPRLTDVDDWYLIASNGPVKPFVRVRKTGFGLKVVILGLDPTHEAARDEMLITEATVYEETYPTRPEFAIKVVN